MRFTSTFLQNYRFSGTVQEVFNGNIFVCDIVRMRRNVRGFDIRHISRCNISPRPRGGHSRGLTHSGRIDPAHSVSHPDSRYLSHSRHTWTGHCRFGHFYSRDLTYNQDKYYFHKFRRCDNLQRSHIQRIFHCGRRRRSRCQLKDEISKSFRRIFFSRKF